MLPPEIATGNVSAAFAREVERIALPLGGASAATGNFSALLHEVQGEVSEFIANGSGGLSGTTLSGAALGFEGQAQLVRMQNAAYGSAAPLGGPGVDRAQQEEFIDSVAPWARAAAGRLGVSPELVAAHAALESGWGQRPLRGADGSDAHNLFGIKAESSWNGGAVSALTTEVLGGAEVKGQQDFRSYAGDADSFADYANLLLDNPRYRGAVNAGDDVRAFAQGLAQGKYATDPAYAHKLENVVRQVRGIGLPRNPADFKAGY